MRKTNEGGRIMELIKCPECGKEISDKAASCPGCGYPIRNMNNFTETIPVSNQFGSYNSIPDINEENNSNNKLIIESTQKRNSVLGILSLVFSIIGCTFIVGIILAIIDLRKTDGKKKTCSIIALVISCLWIVIGIISNGNVDSNNTQNTNPSVLQNEAIESETDNNEEIMEEVEKELEDSNTIKSNHPEDDYDNLGDAFKQGFEDNFNISEENQENIDSIKESISEISNDEEVQEAYDRWKKSLKSILGGQ